MESEIKAFEAKYDNVVKEVLILTEYEACPSQYGNNKMWDALVPILAMVDVETGEFVQKTFVGTWLMTEEQAFSAEKIFDIDGKRIYRLKVQMPITYAKEYHSKLSEMPSGTRFWVREVLERDCHEERLDKILAQFQKTVTLEVKGCQKMLLNKSFGMFIGEGEWNGMECSVHLETDGEGLETAEDALVTWNNLLDNCVEWDKKSREYAAEVLVDNANDWLYDSVEEESVEEITPETFAQRMEINEISVSKDGDFKIYYDDDDMFLGHVIIVNGNIEEGIIDATIAG